MLPSIDNPNRANIDMTSKESIALFNKAELAEFIELTKPLIKWLCDNHHPHAKIIIEPTSAELMYGRLGTDKITEFLND